MKRRIRRRERGGRERDHPEVRKESISDRGWHQRIANEKKEEEKCKGA